MKKILIYITFCFVVMACGGSDDAAPLPPNPPAPPVVVTAASLVFPENNSLCTEAKDLTGNPGDTNRTYTISFRWTGVIDDTYEISLKNENDSNIRTERIKATNTDVVLDVNGIIPGATYSWKVIASREGVTEPAESAEYTFTAAGVAQVSFVPRAAVPNSPKQNASLPATSAVTLSWVGRDDDNDIKEYDIYFGEDNPPTTKIETTASGAITTKEVMVTSNKRYFWRIITRDDAGNESSSAIFRFVVQ